MDIEKLYTLISKRLAIGELNLFNKRFGLPNGPFVLSMLDYNVTLAGLMTICIYYDDIENEDCLDWTYEEIIEQWTNV